MSSSVSEQKKSTMLEGKEENADGIVINAGQGCGSDL